MAVASDIQIECRFVSSHTVLHRKHLDNIGTVVNSTPAEITGSFTWILSQMVGTDLV